MTWVSTCFDYKEEHELMEHLILISKFKENRFEITFLHIFSAVWCVNQVHNVFVPLNLRDKLHFIHIPDIIVVVKYFFVHLFILIYLYIVCFMQIILVNCKTWHKCIHAWCPVV